MSSPLALYLISLELNIVFNFFEMLRRCLEADYGTQIVFVIKKYHSDYAACLYHQADRWYQKMLVLQFLVVPWEGHSAQFNFFYAVALFFLIDGHQFQMSIKIRASE